MITKAEVRLKLLAARQNLDGRAVAHKSRSITDKIERLIDWSQVKSLHCFESITRLNEVNTEPLLAFLQSKYPNIQIYTSRKINNQWQIVRLNGESDASNIKFDAILVPMLGFDDQLNRIGYGGGYYDRLLKTQPKARKIGVCFEQGRQGIIPTETHDCALDLIITENSELSI